MGDNETTPLLPDSLLGGFTKPSESRVSEAMTYASNGGPQHGAWINEAKKMFSAVYLLQVSG